jgi:hypothetical protein
MILLKFKQFLIISQSKRRRKPAMTHHHQTKAFHKKNVHMLFPEMLLYSHNTRKRNSYAIKNKATHLLLSGSYAIK